MRLISRFTIFLFVLLCGKLVVHAQIANVAAADNLEIFKQKLSDLKATTVIPERESIINRELDRVDNEIGSASAAKSALAIPQPLFFTFSSQAGERLTRAAQQLAALDCGKGPGQFQDLIIKYQQETNRLANFLQSNNVEIDPGALFVPQSPNPAESCSFAKNKFSSKEYSDRLSDMLKSAETINTQKQQKNQQMSIVLDEYLSALKERRGKLFEKLNASQTATQIGDRLPLLIFIVALACVGTILGIKLFNDELQMEWVASGQVIQFVTVMILLSVILALGLSRILLENTLGTLLGGIAGYVLAQGVGKQAARDASRAATPANIITPPVPAPAPPPAPMPAVVPNPPGPTGT